MIKQLSTAFHPHDHHGCAHEALKRAEAICEAEGGRLTPVRRRTLEILLQEHRALGAYEVLEKLAKDGFGAQPPVAYRALDFLVDLGLVHRIQGLNAFMACMDHGHARGGQPLFLICKICKSVAEVVFDQLASATAIAARDHDFVVERTNIELLGICPACQCGDEV